MKIFVSLCLSLLVVSVKAAVPGMDSLFRRWNEISLYSLVHDAAATANEEEKSLYQRRLESMPEVWKGNDSLHYVSLRWLFLKEISTEFDWKDKKWSVIEAIKSGEVKRMVNYLVYYKGRQIRIIAYRYDQGKWLKTAQWQERSRSKRLARKTGKVPLNDGCNTGDVVVTDFESGCPIESVCYLEYTLDRESVVSGILYR